MSAKLSLLLRPLKNLGKEDVAKSHLPRTLGYTSYYFATTTNSYRGTNVKKTPRQFVTTYDVYILFKCELSLEANLKLLVCLVSRNVKRLVVVLPSPQTTPQITRIRPPPPAPRRSLKIISSSSSSPRPWHRKRCHPRPPTVVLTRAAFSRGQGEDFHLG